MPAPPKPFPLGAAANAQAGTLLYVKTAAGRHVIDNRTVRLLLRHRQVLLLCTGTHTVDALAVIFGQSVRDDLAALLAQGYIRDAAASHPAASAVKAPLAAAAPRPGPPAPPSPPSPPARPAPPAPGRSGYATPAALEAACAQASAILGVLPAAQAGALLDMCRSLPRREEDVLACLSATLALAVQTWGVRGALPHAEALAGLLPPLTVARLLDCLIDVDAALSAHLYERFLSESQLDAEDAAGQPS